jgi:hypothetical protein
MHDVAVTPAADQQAEQNTVNRAERAPKLTISRSGLGTDQQNILGPKGLAVSLQVIAP